MLNIPKIEGLESFTPDEEQSKFLLKWYRAWTEDNRLKDQSIKHLGNTTLERFFQLSRDNYDVYLPLKSKNDWKRQTKRTLTRDNANGFITKLVKRITVPQVLAQNKDQDIDMLASRIFRVLLEWWERITKSTRMYVAAIHTCVIEGTVHVGQQVVNGREQREIWPNAEIFIPDFYQPVLQQQTHLLRAHITTYENSKFRFGHLPMFNKVNPGAPDRWNIDDEYFSTLITGIEREDEVLIVYLWEHTGYDTETGKPKKKLYNVLINGIPMYPVDNKDVYNHNLYPCSKTVFENFSNVNYYWGNSLPNKIKYDQSYLDAFRTILLNKAILNLLPPLFNKGNEHIDEDVIVPAKITTTQLSSDDIFKIQGVADPITQADIQIEGIVEQQVANGTQPPVALGAQPERQTTLGEIQIRDFRAAELLEIFGHMVGNLIEDMSEQSLSHIMQFELKRDIQKLVNGSELLFQRKIEIADQSLASGDFGTLSLNFLSQDQHPSELDIAQLEEDDRRAGKNVERLFIDPEYFNNLDKYVYVKGNPAERQSELLERMVANENYRSTYFNNPNINQREATRAVIRANKDDEDRLLIDEQQLQQSQPQQELQRSTATQPSTRLKQSTQALKPTV